MLGSRRSDLTAEFVNQSGNASERACGWVAWLTALMSLVSAVLLPASSAAVADHAHNGPNNQVSITSVEGESWLNHLHRDFGDTSMGKTGRLGPGPDEPAADLHAESTQPFSHSPVTLHGQDLYRLNCRGCHGEFGQGAPPEIASLINPVRATSSRLIMQRVKASGMEMSRKQADELAQQSMASLLQRLHQGGQDMPSFSQLNDDEIRALLAYLKQLAGVPGAEREQITVRESPERVGELITKATCHTCHTAAGLNPTSKQLMEGAIPPLSTLTARTNMSGLVRKVTQGAAVTMGAQPMLAAGRMPVFDYLSESEAADVYDYLMRYPPRQTSVVDPTGAASTDAALAAANQAASTQRASADQKAVMIVAWTSGLFIAIVLTAGVRITFKEFARLSAESDAAFAANGAARFPTHATDPAEPELACVSAADEEPQEGEAADWKRRASA